MDAENVLPSIYDRNEAVFVKTLSSRLYVEKPTALRAGNRGFGHGIAFGLRSRDSSFHSLHHTLNNGELLAVAQQFNK